MWFRKGKNVFNTYSSDISYYLRNTDKEKYIINNSNSITVEGNGTTWNRVEITISNLKPNTKYTINSIVTNTTQGYAGLLCDYGNNSVRYVTNKEKFNAKITIVTDENGKVTLQFYTNYSSTTQNSSAIFSEIQLEEGEKATTYKAYIEPKLFVRNSNGVYEEFIKKNEEVYSTEEVKIGTWIDGKSLYRKTFLFTTDSGTYAMKVFNTGIQNADTIFIDIAHSFIKGTDSCIYMINSVRPASDTALTAGAHNWFRINSDKRNVGYVVGSICASSSCTLTVEYTKTTD